jgi:hypothetical protein
MTRWQWFTRATVFFGVILLIAGLSGMIVAQNDLEYSRPCPGGCLPNAKNFGHYPTNWRRWPGEPRIEETNPRAINSEVLTTPEGRQERSLPRARPSQPYQQPIPQPPQPRPQQEPLQQQLPPESPLAVPTPNSPSQEESLPQGGTILPPEGRLLPPAGTLTPPTQPEGQGTKPKSTTKPLIEEGEFPGLDESGPSKKTPSLKGKSSDLMPVPTDAPKNAAATAIPFSSRSTTDAAGVSLVGHGEREQYALPTGIHRADSIGVVPSSSAAGIQPAGYAAGDLAARQEVGSQRIVPTVALNGYCPVELNHNGRWAPGDLRWTVVYRGWIYRLSGPKQREMFLADPDRFAPVLSGNDVVLLVGQNRVVPGQMTHCAIYNNRLYMFSSADTQVEFNKYPNRYAAGK